MSFAIKRSSNTRRIQSLAVVMALGAGFALPVRVAAPAQADVGAVIAVAQKDKVETAARGNVFHDTFNYWAPPE
jgi:hypothetical protein